jgi:hypothetical protein
LWKDNKANGKGRLIRANGETHDVQRLNDKAHGYGAYCHLDDIQIVDHASPF